MGDWNGNLAFLTVSTPAIYLLTLNSISKLDVIFQLSQFENNSSTLLQ